MSERTADDERTEPTRVECPQCGALDGVPIAWGYPAGDTFEAADRGEIVLGGCVVGGDDPTHSCRSCGHSWVHPAVRSEAAASEFADEPDYALAMPIPEETPPGRDPTLMEHTVELLDELIDLTGRVGRLLDEVDPPAVEGDEDFLSHRRSMQGAHRFANHLADYRQRRDQLLGKLHDLGRDS